ncbi:MAG TPA: Ig-like domain-containing protein [Dehalococcoidia bacterium]|jgi:hypothetical protein|nr:Ig-like domain-containing protein [Dehalococcoidia bacterium]
MSKGSLVAAIAAIVSFFVVAQTASAQYPPPKNTLVCTVSTIELKAGESTTLTATLTDSSGKPVAGEVVSFKVIGGDASVSPPSATTNAQGKATTTITAGANPGNLSVSATASYAECRVTSEVSAIKPPTTGDGGLIDTKDLDSGNMAIIGIGAGIAIGLVVMSMLALRKP